jgi:CBS domain containing-hemolysin-like protein
MTALLLVLLLVLVALNGLFVAAEIGLVRSRRAKLEVMANDGVRGAQRALDQINGMTEYIAACQVGITLCSIGIGFLGEPSIAKLLEPVFGNLSDAVATTISVALAFLIVTAIHITFGELVPKLGAIPNSESVAIRLSRPLGAFQRLSRPFTAALTAVATRAVRLLGVGSGSLDGESHTPEDIKVIISQSQSGGDLDAGEAGMLGGVFHLHEQEAREVMTPIPAVITIDASSNVETALRRCISSGHTRLVVIENDNPDKVRGVVHNNSLIRLYMNAGADAVIEPAIREVPIFPETKPLDDLLAELQRQRTSLGVVVDEYGRTVGIVTVEDILEEVVGEIEDETDPQSASVRELADGDFYVRGHVSLGDLEDVDIHLPVDSDAFNSIGGYVFSELGRLPKRGDRIVADGYEIRVESVRDNRIVAVRIHSRATAEFPIAPPPPPDRDQETSESR